MKDCFDAFIILVLSDQNEEKNGGKFLASPLALIMLTNFIML